jgi:hypothetical protein
MIAAEEIPNTCHAAHPRKRCLASACSGEGRDRAKARGVKMGPKFKLTDHQIREAIKRRDKEGETLRSIGRTYNVSAATQNPSNERAPP